MEPWRYISTHSHLDIKWRWSVHFMVRNNLSVPIFCEDILQKRKISFVFAQNCSPIPYPFLNLLEKVARKKEEEMLLRKDTHELPRRGLGIITAGFPFPHTV
jgi:hypothetical protein